MGYLHYPIIGFTLQVSKQQSPSSLEPYVSNYESIHKLQLHYQLLTCLGQKHFGTN